MREEVKDKRGRRIGFVEEDLLHRITVLDSYSRRLGRIEPQGSNMVAYDHVNRKLAIWKKWEDCTYDAQNRRLGKGNLLLGLFYPEL